MSSSGGSTGDAVVLDADAVMAIVDHGSLRGPQDERSCPELRTTISANRS
jgi:hypothetical protein